MNPFLINSILAPTDLTDDSIPALRYARLFADRFHARLTVLYADPIVYPVDFAGMSESLYITAAPEHEARLRADVQRYVSLVTEGRPCDIEIAVGHPIPAILDEERKRRADLVIVGTHLRPGWRRALLGSVSDGVLHNSDCPVLTVASADRGMAKPPYAITNILCPVNYTDVARESLRMAAGVAEAFGARLTIVHVLENDEVMNPSIDEEKVRRWVAPQLQDVCTYRELVVRGGPAERVLDCADDVSADLLVIGAQHRLVRDTTVIGTTTERLVHFATCPVLVVPRSAARRTVRMERDVAAAAHV